MCFSKTLNFKFVFILFLTMQLLSSSCTNKFNNNLQSFADDVAYWVHNIVFDSELEQILVTNSARIKDTSGKPFVNAGQSIMHHKKGDSEIKSQFYLAFEKHYEKGIYKIIEKSYASFLTPMEFERKKLPENYTQLTKDHGVNVLREFMSGPLLFHKNIGKVLYQITDIDKDNNKIGIYFIEIHYPDLPKILKKLNFLEDINSENPLIYIIIDKSPIVCSR